MICPYCDSRLREVPDNRCCPNCGGPLGDKKKPKYPEPPLGIYELSSGFMEIQEQGIHFYERFLWRVIDRCIPYEELYAVRFVPGGKKSGFLCVREKRDKALPLVSTEMEAISDETTVVFASYLNRAYKRVYNFLSEVCELNK